MTLEEHHIEKFERYLKGHMSDKKESEFKDLLSNNKELRQEFYIFSDIFEDINTIAENELRQELSQIHDNFSFDYIRKEKKVKNAYYIIGILLFAILLAIIYFIESHHLKTDSGIKKANTQAMNTVEVKNSRPKEVVEKQSKTKKGLYQYHSTTA